MPPPSAATTFCNASIKGILRSAGNLDFGDAAARLFDLFRKTNSATRQATRNEELAGILMKGGGPLRTDPTLGLLERALINSGRGDAAEAYFNTLSMAPARAAPAGLLHYMAPK